MQIPWKPKHGMVLLGMLLTGLTLMAALMPAGSADQSSAVDNAPRAVFPEIRYQFPSVTEGVQVKHDFYVENTGKAPLLIEKVRPS